MCTINHTQPSCKATGPRVMYEPLEPGQLGSSIPRHGAAVLRDLFHKPFSLTRQGTLRCSLAGHTSGYYLFYNSIIFRGKKHEKSFIWGSAIYKIWCVLNLAVYFHDTLSWEFQDNEADHLYLPRFNLHWRAQRWGRRSRCWKRRFFVL